MDPNQGPTALYQFEAGQTSVEVCLSDDTAWLNQAQIEELFQQNKHTLSDHIRTAFKEDELNEQAVVRNFRTTAEGGKKYKTNFYNLDVIISVGYRIKSQIGTPFCIWVTSVLKNHLIRGYTFNERLLARDYESTAYVQ